MPAIHGQQTTRRFPPALETALDKGFRSLSCSCPELLGNLTISSACTLLTGFLFQSISKASLEDLVKQGRACQEDKSFRGPLFRIGKASEREADRQDCIMVCPIVAKRAIQSKNAVFHDPRSRPYNKELSGSRYSSHPDHRVRRRSVQGPPSSYRSGCRTFERGSSAVSS
jgi:hypothetical protein